MKDIGDEDFERYWSNPSIAMYLEQKGDFWCGNRTNGGHICSLLTKAFNRPAG